MKRLFLLCAVALLLLTGCAQKKVESTGEPDYAQKEVESTGEHTHLPAETAQTKEDPITGYCGNTQTTVVYNGETISLMFGPSVTLTDLLINLDYDPNKTCKCADYDVTVTTEFGGPYYISLDSAYARYTNDDGVLSQADLTAEQLQIIQSILK